MKLFNSFKKLISDSPKFSSFIPNHTDYWAHTPKQEGQLAETATQHFGRVNEYILKLVKAHSLDKVVDTLINEIIANQTEFTHADDLGNYIKALFIRSILFHDYGKVNPNFQHRKMSNPAFNWDNSIKIDSQHSKLSAFIFIHYHIKESLELTFFGSTERKFLWVLIFLFASPIIRHHSSYLDHKESTFDESLKKFLPNFLKYFKTEISADKLFEKKQYEQLFADFYNIYKYENYFPVFALLKLNFSLLTAADYYATNEYTNGFILNDIGLLDKTLKDKIFSNFQNNKDYNKELFERFDYFQQLSFDDLQSKSNKNLNLLRQKLMVEVIGNTRLHYKNNLFYLEAPTGAGKTNLSLAVITVLLKLNPEIDKVFYVFPFNTLINQTFSAIKDTLGLSNSEIIQLHSKSGFHEKDSENEKDALYGKEYMNFIDNLFINYPVTLFSHVRFFDILKGNNKESNYILHRLTNSIVIIDELQSYNPKHWDKIIFYLSHYAKYFNIKIVLMSATLPKLDELDRNMKGNIIGLVENKYKYFINQNFKGRVIFNFELLSWKDPSPNQEKTDYLISLKEFLYKKAEEQAISNENRVTVIIEFIKKKTAGEFLRLVELDDRFSDYQKLLVSGEILEPRRKHIIDIIKSKLDDKILLITTQVVEAGVDIDMDLGFKDKSLIDSDEQLAGRVNRNAAKHNCKVYIFNCDSEATIYRKDERYKISREQINQKDYQEILETKNFDKLYKLVNEKINHKNDNPYQIEALPEYLNHIKNLSFNKVNWEFQLIEDTNSSVFVPLSIPKNHFSEEDIKCFEAFGIEADMNDNIKGEEVWQKYEEIISSRRTEEFTFKQIELKKMAGLLSKFMFSVYKSLKDELFKTPYIDREISDKFGIIYLRYWFENNLYSYEKGFDYTKIDCDNFI
ncbi:MAG: CRISPR-associated helicase Cas3' [Bacteroidales bacterium]|nr:CRISPR-associated helicase Cas3' [Bacteroidales bacterium]